MQKIEEPSHIARVGVFEQQSQNLLLRSYRRFFAAFLSLWLLSAGLILCRGKFYLKLADPTLSFWFDNGNDAHADLTGFNRKTQRFTSRETGEPVVVYPAPMMMVYSALSRWSVPAVWIYGIVVTLTALALALCFGWLAGFATGRPDLSYPSALVLMALYYPLWFVFERSNVEAILWLPAASCAIAFVFGRYKTAAILVALAASLKIYPGILMLVFLRKGRLRYLALSLVSYVAFTGVGLWWLNPNLLAAWQELNAGLSNVARNHLTYFEGVAIGYDHSYFSVVKQIIRFLYPYITRYQPDLVRVKIVAAMQVYTVAAPLAFALAFTFWIRKLPEINVLIILIICSVTLPPVSYEYTLLQVGAAFGLLLVYLVDLRTQNARVPSLWRVAVCASFIAVSLPLAFIGGATVGYGGQIKLFALLIPIAFCLLYPIDICTPLQPKVSLTS